VVAKQQDKH